MKNQIFLAVAVAGMLGVQPPSDASAEVRMDISINSGSGFYFERRPDFIYLDNYGFFVSYGGPYEVIYFDNAYFISRDGYWYRAWDYRGPWERIYYDELPRPIRRHGWEEIRRYREAEYRRHERRYWDEQFRHDRDRWGGPEDRRRFEAPPPPPPPPPPQPHQPSGVEILLDLFGKPQGPEHRPSGAPAPAPVSPPQPQRPAAPQAPAPPPAPAPAAQPAPQRPAGQQKPDERRDEHDRRDDRDGRSGPENRQQGPEHNRPDGR